METWRRSIEILLHADSPLCCETLVVPHRKGFLLDCDPVDWKGDWRTLKLFCLWFRFETKWKKPLKDGKLWSCTDAPSATLKYQTLWHVSDDWLVLTELKCAMKTFSTHLACSYEAHQVHGSIHLQILNLLSFSLGRNRDSSDHQAEILSGSL